MLYTPYYEQPIKLYLAKIFFGRESEALQDVNLEVYIGMDDDSNLQHAGLSMKMGVLQNLLLTLGETGHQLIPLIVDEMEDVLGESPAIVGVVDHTGGLLSLNHIDFVLYRQQDVQSDGTYAADDTDPFWVVDSWALRE